MPSPTLLAAGLSILVLLSLGIVTFSNYRMARQVADSRKLCSDDHDYNNDDDDDNHYGSFTGEC